MSEIASAAAAVPPAAVRGPRPTSSRATAMIAAARRRRRLRQVLPWAVIVGMFLFWEIGVRAFSVPEFVLPAPSAVFASLWEYQGPILSNAWQTLMTSALGFGFAVIFGITLGCAIGASTLVYAALYPLLIAVNAIPKVAVVPVLVIWFGIGTVPAVITAFLLSFFPIVVNVATGIATVEPELRDVLRALGAGTLDIVVKIGLPRAMPYFFASLKIAVTVAFVGSILAETVAANEGIGHLMVAASSRFDVPLVFAGLVVTSVMGVGMYALSALVEGRVTGWTMRGAEQNVAVMASTQG